MEKEKKKWEAPKLICLYKGRSEEAVLQVCKGSPAAGTGSGGPNCSQTQPAGNCKTLGTS